MVKLSDFVFDFLSKQGVTDVFMVSGGGIMYLTDSLRKNPYIKYICNHHEQASAIAAESFARYRNNLGVCLATTGPGAVNALSGIVGAWVDSLPVLVIAGQVRRDLIADYSKLRQFGPQEVNIIELAKPVTKYATTIMDPSRIKYELEYAIYVAKSGRPGPVWICIPLDVQAAMVDPNNLISFSSKIEPALSYEKSTRQVEESVKMISESRRPVVLLGAGVRLSDSVQEIGLLMDKLNAPVLTNMGSIDIIHEDHPLFFGRFGPIGQRRSNFVLQNADLVLSLGASMSVGSIGFNTKGFAPKAKKIMVNIDEGELQKSSFIPDLSIRADLKWYLMQLVKSLKAVKITSDPRWLEKCNYWKNKYPTLTPDYFEDNDHVNSYVFASRLSEHLDNRAVVVAGNSLDIVSIYHSFNVKAGQRVYSTINYGSMGWDLPGVLGACIGNNRRETILITGDGTIQFNQQELNTISYNRLPVKIFIFNNDGYASIRTTQDSYFDGKYIGCDVNSGIKNPKFQKLAEAYGFEYFRIDKNENINDILKLVLIADEPVICELNLSRTQGRSPRITSVRNENGTMESRPLEDQFPFIDRQELRENMHFFD